MSEQEISARETDADTQRRPMEGARVRHFKAIGVDRVECVYENVTVEPDEPGECIPCGMDQVLAVFGDDNLE